MDCASGAVKGDLGMPSDLGSGRARSDQLVAVVRTGQHHSALLEQQLEVDPVPQVSGWPHGWNSTAPVGFCVVAMQPDGVAIDTSATCTLASREPRLHRKKTERQVR